MTLEFKPISLDVDSGDSSGMLVLRNGALLAVVSELGEMHGELAGLWFIEKVFHPAVPWRRAPFPDIPAVDDWLSAQVR